MYHTQDTSLCIVSLGRHASLCRVPHELLPGALTGRTTHQKARRGHGCLTGGQSPMAHRGQSCLAGRTTINGLTDSETETSMDACTACSKYSRWVVAGTVDEETAACRAFRASLTAVWILESSLSSSWSIQAGSAPTAEGPGVLVDRWWRCRLSLPGTPRAEHGPVVWRSL